MVVPNYHTSFWTISCSHAYWWLSVHKSFTSHEMKKKLELTFVVIITYLYEWHRFVQQNWHWAD
jgi:hypothetical protein